MLSIYCLRNHKSVVVFCQKLIRCVLEQFSILLSWGPIRTNFGYIYGPLVFENSFQVMSHILAVLLHSKLISVIIIVKLEFSFPDQQLLFQWQLQNVCELKNRIGKITIIRKKSWISDFQSHFPVLKIGWIFPYLFCLKNIGSWGHFLIK